jgi:hypothetical protein
MQVFTNFFQVGKESLIFLLGVNPGSTLDIPAGDSAIKPKSSEFVNLTNTLKICLEKLWICNKINSNST